MTFAPGKRLRKRGRALTAWGFVLAGLTLSGAAALVVVPGAFNEANPEPPSINLEPRVGDWGEYHAYVLDTRAGSAQVTEGPNPAYRMAWSPQLPARVANGSLDALSILVIHTAGPPQDGPTLPVQFAFDPATLELVSRVEVLDRRGPEDHDRDFGSPQNASATVRVQRLFVGLDEGAPPCGAVVLPGRDAGPAAVALPRCAWNNRALPPTRLALQGPVTLSTGPAALFQGSADGLTVYVWMAPDRAQAAQLAWERPGEAGRYDALVLAASGRGDGPAAGANRSRAAPPALVDEGAPRRAWGPDDATWNHAYPLSAAFDAALRCATFPALRDFMAAHPDAFVEAAQQQTRESSMTLARTWRFVVTDGVERLSVRVTQSGPNAAQQRPLAERALTEETVEAGGAWQGAGFDADAAPPTLESLPTRTLTLTSYVKRWPLWANSFPTLEDASAWGFRWRPDPSTNQADLEIYVLPLALRSFLPPLGLPGQPAPPPVFAHAGVRFGPAGDVHEVWSEEDGHQYDLRRVSGAPQPPEFNVHAYGPGAAQPEWTLPRAPLVWGGALALVVGAWKLLGPRVFPAVFHSRIRTEDALQHPVRSALHATITASPGIHYRELRRRHGLSNGQLQHHLNKLIQLHQIRVVAQGGYTCYYAAGPGPPPRVPVEPLLKARGSMLVYTTVLRDPGLGLAQLSRVTGLSPRTVGYHVDRMRSAGLVETHRMGRVVRVQATEAGRRAPAAVLEVAAAQS